MQFIPWSRDDTEGDCIIEKEIDSQYIGVLSAMAERSLVVMFGS